MVFVAQHYNDRVAAVRADAEGAIQFDAFPPLPCRLRGCSFDAPERGRFDGRGMRVHRHIGNRPLGQDRRPGDVWPIRPGTGSAGYRYPRHRPGHAGTKAFPAARLACEVRLRRKKEDRRLVQFCVPSRGWFRRSSLPLPFNFGARLVRTLCRSDGPRLGRQPPGASGCCRRSPHCSPTTASRSGRSRRSWTATADRNGPGATCGILIEHARPTVLMPVHNAAFQGVFPPMVLRS